jgi:hypothetical protein
MSGFGSFWSSIPSFLVVLAVVWWLALCGLTAWLAHGKGHNPIGFLVIAFFFSPVLGLLALIAARDLRNVSEVQMARDTFRQMMGPLMLQIDGIRGHLVVSEQTLIMPPPAELLAMRSKVTPPAHAI